MNNKIIESLIREILYKNPSKEDIDYINEALNLLKNYNKKIFHKCGHNKCEAKSIDSHEISESVFIKKISQNNLVFTLIPDFKENSMRYKIKEENIRNATTFAGYCESHDKSIFKSIEDNFSGFNDEFVHKQVLRTLRKEIYKFETAIPAFRILLEKSNKNKEIKKTIIKYIQRLRKYKAKYRNLSSNIYSSKNCLYFKIIELPPKKLTFGAMYTPLLPDDKNIAYVFIYIFHVKNKNILLSATFEDTKDFLNDIFPKKLDLPSLIDIHHLIESKKENMVFSEEFINSLSDNEKDYLINNPEFLMSPFIFPIPNFLI